MTKKDEILLPTLAFFAGFCIMSIELCASRILNPGFGSSIQVWGALLGIIMLALSIGYYIGGKLADTSKNKNLISNILLYSSILTAIIPILGFPTVYILSNLGLTTGAILSTIILFFLPMSLLSMISPIVIKYTSKNLKTLGVNAGKIYSLSTIGSILGVFLTSFMLLSLIGTKKTIILNSIILLILSLASYKKPFQMKHTLGFITLITVILSPGYQHPDRIYETESNYNIIQVYENENAKSMQLGWSLRISQTFQKKNQTLTDTYHDFFAITPLINNAKTTLHLGVAGGSNIKIQQHFYNMKIDAVEIDPKVIETSRKYFDLKENENVKIYTMDARRFLKKGNKYDSIILDVFTGGFLPPHLTTIEFFQECNKNLNEDGTILINTISTNGNLKAIQAIGKTLQEIFPTTYYVKWNSNYFLIATKKKMTINEINEKIKQNTNPELEHIARRFTENIKPIKKTNNPILTDDKNNIEELMYQAYT